MRSPEAIAAALGMLLYPHIARKARRHPLPHGITFLLEVAANDPEALREAAAITGQTQATLRKAAGFFIEQIMLDEGADLYRVLGANPTAPIEDLRRHMALIMRWLHPDLMTAQERDGGFNRSVYANRVVAAWETLKSQARRSAYDVTRVKTECNATQAELPAGSRLSRKAASPAMAETRSRARRPVPRARRRPAALSHILNLFGFRP
ncbi:hypothetical protein KKP04_05520 [Rhodomicrobium sp. Az07]|uniref:hypothetical protein n=1 Tax=Rhodomicrobium sp. Az07 TaxID=2839034 RepID=UPI001BEB166D|nr:hypothetical protein [Rhodomicrobium sp. Az07]MBT3070324.1 hypothetical protein [Rhodomicrobium sp. Az07]